MHYLRFKNQNCSSDGGGPQSTLVANGRLGDVAGAHNLVGDAVDFLLLVPARIRIEVHIESGGKHFGRKFLSVFPGLFFRFTETVVLAEITVSVAIGRDGNTNARN